MEKLVSILIPAYNSAKYVTETVQSALSQTHRNIEIIIVNDGSIDDTLAVAKKFESNRVKVIDQPNQGASAARNRAFAESAGEFIQYLDSDDILDPIKIETQVKQLLENNLTESISVCAYKHFLDGTDFKNGSTDDMGVNIGDSDDTAEWLLKLYGIDRNPGMVQTSAWLMPRSVHEKAGLWDEDIFVDDDGDFFNKALLSAKSVTACPIIGFYYRKFASAKNLSAQKNWKSFRDQIKSWKNKSERILKKNTDQATKQLFCEHLYFLGIMAYPQYKDLTAEAHRIAMLYSEPKGTFVNLNRLTPIQKLFGWKFTRLTAYYFNRYFR